jgi:hypothetical protein
MMFLKKSLLDNLAEFKQWIRPAQIELISIHIPKTAGTSFRAALDNVYGKSLATDYSSEKISNPHIYKAIHGHFPAAKYAKDFPRAKTIMWLRHPVNRIVSYYHFWKKTPRHGNPNHDFFLDNVHNMTVVDFAELPFIRNELPDWYLHDFDISRFFFVGITERYNQDLQRLAKLMKWKNIQSYEHNVTERKAAISLNEHQKIKELYRFEMDLYNHYLNRSV